MWFYVNFCFVVLPLFMLLWLWSKFFSGFMWCIYQNYTGLLHFKLYCHWNKSWRIWINQMNTLGTKNSNTKFSPTRDTIPCCRKSSGLLRQHRGNHMFTHFIWIQMNQCNHGQINVMPGSWEGVLVLHTKFANWIRGRSFYNNITSWSGLSFRGMKTTVGMPQPCGMEGHISYMRLRKYMLINAGSSFICMMKCSVEEM